jgi:hypothetical protein
MAVVSIGPVVLAYLMPNLAPRTLWKGAPGVRKPLHWPDLRADLEDRFGAKKPIAWEPWISYSAAIALSGHYLPRRRVIS